MVNRGINRIRGYALFFFLSVNGIMNENFGGIMKKYLFFDIDGTLTGEQGRIYDSTRRTLRQLEANGHFIAITTGRAHFRAQEFADEIGISYMVCEGGNAVCVNNEILNYEPMNQKALIRVCEEAQEKGIGFAYSNQDSRIRYTPNDAFIKQAGDFSMFMEVQVKPELDYHHCGVLRRIFVALPPSEEYRLSSMNGIGYMRYNDQFLIIEPDNKYHGIRKMMKLIQAPESDVVVFGDGFNDRKMFQQAPFKIAMGNAIDELKELADYVTADCDNDGIEKACRHFGWI